VVSAVNAFGESADSNEASATPQAAPVPAPPTNLAVSPSGKRKLTLTWIQSESPAVTQNNVYRSTTSGGPYLQIAILSATTSYQDAGLTSGQTYHYRVTAVSSGGESVYSNESFGTAR
jgi:fibronectin type 3 domain-containing protein